MALATAEYLEGGLTKSEQRLDLPLCSPNNPVIRLRALRVYDLLLFAFVCSFGDRAEDEIIRQPTLLSNGLRSPTSGGCSNSDV